MIRAASDLDDLISATVESPWFCLPERIT